MARDPKTGGRPKHIAEVVRMAQEAWSAARPSNAGEGRRERREAESERQRLREDRLRAAGVLHVLEDGVVRSLITGSLKSTRYLAAVERWLTEESPYLFLLGTVGTGKTTASASALGECGGIYLRARDLERLFAARFGPSLEEQQRVRDSRLVVVDDLGTESDLTGFSATLCELVDSRPDARFRTIFTGNMTLEELWQRYTDERLVSRVRSRSKFVGKSGPDMRLDKKNKTTA